MNMDIFAKRKNNFNLWRITSIAPAPELIIGQLQLGAPVSFVGEQRFTLQQSAEFDDLWFLSADAWNLLDDKVYHYWFEVTDSHPKRSGKRISVTDPLAYTVDWRLLAPQPADAPFGEDDRYPAAVIKYSQGELISCDAGGETGALMTLPFPPYHPIIVW
jgi:pullulanase